MTRVGVYPGSFNPPTVAHRAVSLAAIEQHHLDEVVWVVSRHALGKGAVEVPRFDQRIEVLQAVAAAEGWLRVEVTDAQLLADIAEGFDVVIMGADKWHQINEAQWYADDDERHRQLARLPPVAIAPRGDLDVPDPYRLDVTAAIADVSSSAARAGDRTSMLDAAAASGLWDLG